YTHPKVDDAAQAYAPSIFLARHTDQLGSLDQDQPIPSTADPACSSGHLPSPASHHSKGRCFGLAVVDIVILRPWGVETGSIEKESKEKGSVLNAGCEVVDQAHKIKVEDELQKGSHVLGRTDCSGVLPMVDDKIADQLEGKGEISEEHVVTSVQEESESEEVAPRALEPAA
ncbi:hypothetical protein U1Q18_025652, partial [Sarracenia purpurea var. burkii]